MSTVWKTKFGPRRVKHDPPTLAEAIFAARGLTDDPHAQVEIAASLMDLPIEDVRTAVLEAGPERKAPNTIAFTNRNGSYRPVIVERKASRRPMGRRFGS